MTDKISPGGGVEDTLRARMLALKLPSTSDPGTNGTNGPNSNGGPSPDHGSLRLDLSPAPSSASSTPLISSSRPRRPNLTRGGGGFPPSSARRPENLAWPSPSSPFASGESSGIEQQRKLNEIMSQSGMLTLPGRGKVQTAIDDLELLGDLGNGTCGHVVKMRHRQEGHVIAVKQMRRTGNSDENKRIVMDLDVVLKSYDCEHIVLCLGCFITDSDVWICMELMATCFDKLLKQLKQSIPEAICGKVAVSTLKALNYLKETHGVIHRDVKPSNILLDTSGRVKICDFGISGRLVDSKAKTRSAGCPAYMAPERIDPPNPNKPDYDIRADVWSLGITLVELATGHFPYRDCKTDFEVLTKVLQDDPPLLPRNHGFSVEFCSFVRDCLMKNYKDRPKYKKLLQHPFIKRYEKEAVDVGAWYRSHMKNFESTNSSNHVGGPTGSTASISNSSVSPNNNTSNLPASSLGPQPDSLSIMSASSDRGSFKPQPSPRVTRAWKPSNLVPSPTTPPGSSAPPSLGPASHYPSAISDPYHSVTSSYHHQPNFTYQQQRSQPEPLSSGRRPSTEDPRSTRTHQQFQTSSSTSMAASSPFLGSRAGQTSSSSTYFGSRVPYSSSSSSGPSSHPVGSSLSYSTSMYHSPFLSRRTAGGASSGPSSLQDEHLSARPPPPSYRDSPRTAKKFDFTFPTSLQTTTSSGSNNYESLYHQYRTGTNTDRTKTPGSAEPLRSPYESERRPSYGWSGSRMTTSDYGQGTGTTERASRLGRPADRSDSSMGAVGGAAAIPPLAPGQQRSPSQERQGRPGYNMGSWRSTLSSTLSNWQSPFSLRRLRTASTDRSSTFDTSRRFHPSYRSWNEKDNFANSLRR